MTKIIRTRHYWPWCWISTVNRWIFNAKGMLCGGCSHSKTLSWFTVWQSEMRCDIIKIEWISGYTIISRMANSTFPRWRFPSLYAISCNIKFAEDICIRKYTETHIHMCIRWYSGTVHVLLIDWSVCILCTFMHWYLHNICLYCKQEVLKIPFDFVSTCVDAGMCNHVHSGVF